MTSVQYDAPPGAVPVKSEGWSFSRAERIGLAVALFVIVAFGANLEQRTALRRMPMTDVGVPARTAWAVFSGENLYQVSEWHGWHYGYPPIVAILFTPLAQPPPEPLPALGPGEVRTDANTPWGYEIANKKHYYGLHPQNVRFFCIIAVWYFLNVVLISLSAHALACALEGKALREPPPQAGESRRRWWWLRTLPLLVCAGSLVTDLARGQVDVIMLTTMSLGLYWATRAKYFRAGVWLAWPAAIKLFPFLLFLYPLWRRRWRMLSGAATGLFLSLALIPVLVLGPSRTVEVYGTWLQVLAKPGLGLGQDASRARELTAMNGTDNQSLLAFLHNWRYFDLPRKQRPANADPGERLAVYGVGVLLFLGIVLVAGKQREDSPRNLLILCGLFMGLALVVNPVVHNYYYLLLLPVIAAFLDHVLAQVSGRATIWRLPWVLPVFMVTDILARLPGIGPFLRDVGVPFVSMVFLLIAAAMVLRRTELTPTDQEDRVKLDRIIAPAPTL